MRTETPVHAPGQQQRHPTPAAAGSRQPGGSLGQAHQRSAAGSAVSLVGGTNRFTCSGSRARLEASSATKAV